MHSASGFDGARPVTNPLGKQPPKAVEKEVSQSAVSQTASSSEPEMMPYAQTLKDSLVQSVDTIPLVDDELSRPIVDSSGKMTWEANSKNLGHDTYTCDVVYDPNERLFYAEDQDGRQKNIMFSPAKLRKSLEKGLGIPLIIQFDDDKNILVTSGGRLKGAGPKPTSQGNSSKRRKAGGFTERTVPKEVSDESEENISSRSESNSPTSSAGSRDDSIINRLSLSGDRPLFNTISQQGKLNALQDILDLEQMGSATQGASTSLIEAFQQEDIPKETRGKLSSDEHDALNWLGKCWARFSLRYNPILAEAWGRSMESRDGREDNSGWAETGVTVTDYTNAAKNFKKNMATVVSEVMETLSPTELSRTQNETKAVLERWTKVGFSYSSWENPSQLTPFEKHHIMPKNTMPEGSLSGTNLVLLPKELHQLSVEKANRLGLPETSSAHSASSGTGDTKTIIRTRAAILLDRVNKEGEKLEFGRYR